MSAPVHFPYRQDDCRILMTEEQVGYHRYILFQFGRVMILGLAVLHLLLEVSNDLLTVKFVWTG